MAIEELSVDLVSVIMWVTRRYTTGSWPSSQPQIWKCFTKQGQKHCDLALGVVFITENKWSLRIIKSEMYLNLSISSLSVKKKITYRMTHIWDSNISNLVENFWNLLLKFLNMNAKLPKEMISYIRNILGTILMLGSWPKPAFLTKHFPGIFVFFFERIWHFFSPFKYLLWQ